jgi:dTDP-4-dehydrorhamnose reductase
MQTILGANGQIGEELARELKGTLPQIFALSAEQQKK